MTTIDTVKDIPENYTLVTESHERDQILEHIGENPEGWSHGSLFVLVENAEYTDVLFFAGNVPYLYKNVTRVK